MTIAFVQASTPSFYPGNHILETGGPLTVSNTITGVAPGNVLVLISGFGFFPTSWTPYGPEFKVNGSVVSGYSPAEVQIGDGAAARYILNTIGAPSGPLAGPLAGGSYTVDFIWSSAELFGVTPVLVDPWFVILEYSGLDHFASVSNSGAFDFALYSAGLIFFPAHANPNSLIVTPDTVPLIFCYNPITSISASVDNDSTPPPSGWSTRVSYSSGNFQALIVEATAGVTSPYSIYTGFNRAAAIGSPIFWGGNFISGALSPPPSGFSYDLQAHSVGIGLAVPTPPPPPAGSLVFGHALNCNAYDQVDLSNGAKMAPGHGILITQN